MASLQAVNPEPEEKGAEGEKGEGQASRAAGSPYQPRKATSRASKPIAFKAKNFISEAEKVQLQRNTHTPWESEQPVTERGRQVTTLPLVLVSVMICFAAYLFFRSQKMGTPVPESLKTVAVATDAPDYEAKLTAVLKNFCESGDLSSIKGVIRHADQLGGIVEDYYRGTAPPRNTIVRARLPSDSMFLSPLENSLLRVLLTFAGGEQRDIMLEWAGGEAKVDWGHWVCYNPVPVADFLDPAGQAGAEHEFRLVGRLPAKYRTSKRFPEIRYGCVVFQDKGHDGRDFEAYVLRDTELHDRVMACLAGNIDNPLIVKLLRHSDKTKGGAGIEVTGMVTEGWVRAMPAAAGPPQGD